MFISKVGVAVLMSLLAGANASWGSSKLKVDLLNLPSQFNPRILGSASAFIITDQCLRNLLKIDESGQLAGDLAESWQISKNHREFRFKLRPAKFSNGDAITAKDVVESINHPEFRKTAIHFDFNSIERVSADGETVMVLLKEANFNFLFHLTQPEFGVYHSSDRGKAATLSVTSGPYTLSEMNSQHVMLKKNPNYAHSGPATVEIVALGANKYSALESGKVDMALLFEDPPDDVTKRLTDSGSFDFLRPHVGFTFWLSLNPNSPAFQNKNVRSVFQRKVRSRFQQSFSPTITWEMASQLFLPKGPGRLSGAWVDQFWARPEPAAEELKGRKFHGLISDKFQFSEELRKVLESVARELKAELKIDTYSDQAEFARKLKSAECDFYLINNDFSSFELVQNLVVTFNKSKPLIIFDSKNNKLEALWANIQKAEIAEKRYEGLMELSKGLLEDALIAPLLYKQVPILKRKSVDLSLWSHLFPEFAFWKVKFNANPPSN